MQYSVILFIQSCQKSLKYVEVYNSTLIHPLVIATLFYHGAMHVSIQQLEDNVTLGHMKDAFCNPTTSALITTHKKHEFICS